jgi:hypothetical protein
MKSIIALFEAVLASTIAADPQSSLSSVLIWSTIGVWLAILFALASIVAVLARTGVRRTQPVPASRAGSVFCHICPACAC